MDLERVVPLLLLLDPHQVLLRTLLQHLLVLGSREMGLLALDWKEDRWCSVVNGLTYPCSDLLEALQDRLEVLVPPEEVGQGALHRVEVGHGLVPLHG